MSMPISMPDFSPSGGTPLEEKHSKQLFGPDLHADTTAPKENASIADSVKVPHGNVISLLDSQITIGQYCKAVVLSLNNSKQTISSGQLFDFLASKTSTEALMDASTALAAIRVAMLEAQQSQVNLNTQQNSQISAENTAIDAYNSAVTSTQVPPGEDAAQIATMNQAITNFNNGSITETQFNTAVAQYNIYFSGRNAALAPDLTTYNASVANFQGQVDANNAIIEQLNSTGAQAGIPPLPLQDDVPSLAQTFPLQSPAPLPLPIPLIPNPVSPSDIAALPPPLDQSDFLAANFQPIANSILTSNMVSQRSVDVLNAIIDYYNIFLPGQSITQIPSFSSQLPLLFQNAAATVRASGGVGIVNLSSFADSPNASGAIATGILASDNDRFQLMFSEPFYTHYASYSLQLAAAKGLESSVPGIQMVGAEGMGGGRSADAFGVAFGVSYGQIIAEEVNSGRSEQFVRQLIQNNLPAPENPDANFEQERATNVLTANLNIFLLENALLTAGLSSGAPGLLGQIIGNTGFSQAALQTSSLTHDQVVADTLKQGFIQSQVASRLAQGQTTGSQTTANAVVNNAFTTVLSQGTIPNIPIFTQRFNAALQNNGVSSVKAAELAEVAANLLEAETKSEALINKGVLNESVLAQELSKHLSDASNLSSDEASAAARQAVQQTFLNSFFTNGTELQYVLHQQLINSGIAGNAAATASQKAVTALNVLPAGTSPLISPVLKTVLSPEDLKTEVYEHVHKVLAGTLAAERTKQIADLAVSTYVGGTTSSKQHSILSLLDENLKLLQKQGRDTWTQSLLRNFQNFMAPNADLLTFSRKLMDPAYNLFYSFNTGVMYAGRSIPSNWKRELDVKV